MTEPRTEAGRRLLEEYRADFRENRWEDEGWDPAASAANLARDILAIEAEAIASAGGERVAAAGPLNSGHQLRAEQEGWAIPYAPCICHGFPPHQHDEGLGVERLARAMWNVRAGGVIDNRNAADVAREYAALAEDRAADTGAER